MSFLSPNGVFSNSHRRYRRTAAASTAVVLSIGVLQAQEVPLTDSARQVYLDVRERFEYSDNPDLEVEGEDRFTARTSVELGYVRRSAIDSFALSLGADLDLTSNDENGIERPNLGLVWERDVRRARTRLSFGLREVDLGSTTRTIFDEDTESIDFGTLDQGTRRTANLGFDGAFGVDAPFGGNYRLLQSQIRYTGTEDPDLLDADRLILEGGLFFALDSTNTVGIEVGQTDFDEDGEGAIDTVSTFFGTYLETDINPRLTGRFDLGWEEVEDTGAINSLENGAVFNVALTQDTARGALSFDAGSSITTGGRRDELRVGHLIEQSTGALGYSVGLTNTEGSSTEPVFGLSWSRDLPRGSLTLALDQNAFTDRDRETQINSLFSLEYAQALTARSGFDVDLSLLDVNELDATGSDTRRLDLALTYRYALTEDWDLTSGISFVREAEDDVSDRDANTVFIGVERRFVWN